MVAGFMIAVLTLLIAILLVVLVALIVMVFALTYWAEEKIGQLFPDDAEWDQYVENAWDDLRNIISGRK